MHLILFPFILVFRLVQFILKITLNLLRSIFDFVLKIVLGLLRFLFSTVHFLIYSSLKVIIKTIMSARFVFQLIKLALVVSLRYLSNVPKLLSRALHPVLHPLTYFFRDVVAFLGLGDDFVILIMKPFSPIFSKIFGKSKQTPQWKVVSSKRKRHA